jgi:hypothetical protein
VRAELRKAAEAAEDEELRDLARDLLQNEPVPLAERPITTPADLDMLWGAFFATGEAVYVRRILGVLPWSNDPDKNVARMMVGSAARWSLKSHAPRHPKVMDICEEALAEAEGPLKTLLAEVIEDGARGPQGDPAGPESLSGDR